MRATFVRRQLSRRLAGQAELVLRNRTPTHDELGRRFESVRELGLYVHIPFCRQICPYCPYNKELFRPELAERYTAAVRKEIDFYADLVGTRPVTSLYLGGGTPTTVLHRGLAGILDHIHAVFDVRCDIHMESHPNDLSDANLDAIESLKIRHLSTGVELLQDKHHWRIYETRFTKKDFRRRFGRDFDRVYGRYFKTLQRLGFLQDDGEQIVLTDKGSYWLHSLEDLFSIDYVSRLWGTAKHEPWPGRVAL